MVRSRKVSKVCLSKLNATSRSADSPVPPAGVDMYSKRMPAMHHEDEMGIRDMNSKERFMYQPSTEPFVRRHKP